MVPRSRPGRWPCARTLEIYAKLGIAGRALELGQRGAGGSERFPWLRLRFETNGPNEDSFKKLDDTRFNLIVIGQPAPAESASVPGELLHTHVIPDEAGNTRELARAGVPSPAFFLLRPDGHVGLSGARLKPGAVSRYFSAIGANGDRAIGL